MPVKNMYKTKGPKLPVTKIIKGGKDVVKELGIPVASAGFSVFNINPLAGVALAGISGIWSLMDKWSKNRAKELKIAIGDKKILDLIKRDDKTRDVIVKILFNIFQECSEDKRKLYYKYINQLHKNVHPSFDYHSKVIFIINLITFEEIQTLIKFKDNYNYILGKITEMAKQKNPQAKVNETETRGANLSEIEVVEYFSKQNRDNLEDWFVNLGNYGLLSVKNGRYGGTYLGPITEFGKTFLDFISEGIGDI